MKLALLSILSVFITFSVAHAATFDGYYVSNNGDTVKCKIKAAQLLLKKQEINPLSVTRSVHVKSENGKVYNLKPSEIRSFKIIGLQNGSVEFKTMEGDKDHFYQVWTEGKIKLYAFYSTHPYDNSPVPHFFAYTPAGKLVAINPTDLNKQLGELIQDDKELYNAWLSKEYSDKGLVPMVKLYNSRYLISSQNEPADRINKN